MFVAVDNTNTFFSDNPYYFYNDNKSPRTPDSQSSSKGFSIFKRRNSKGNSPRVVLPEQLRLITSANLDSAATIALGSPRGSFGSLSAFSHQTFELQPLVHPRQRSSNSHSESFRERLGSYNESSACTENDGIFNVSPASKHHHHTLPSSGIRRHSFGNWRQNSERHLQHKNAALTTPDEVPNMMAPRPPVISPNKYRGLHRRREYAVSPTNQNYLI
ncbi:uncharacterized protein LOC119676278 [Teleopsis dalmanni]|uniref:uncharacterized protein LOC119676278 n=1 Tax=Teleopsis dalmanni TaxID=139649 RepID=UPI0018CE45E3|nr:uncharacterized protein LOC119676278 [Teleopsis dalmanni]